mmetsp:Transcript_27403/g.60679  ORF Transcript_27403/g.60679 Transcript_27403/m.60679 type:complete len:211 (+) Transcript_27403:907-1539(+)
MFMAWCVFSTECSSPLGCGEKKVLLESRRRGHQVRAAVARWMEMRTAAVWWSRRAESRSWPNLSITECLSLLWVMMLLLGLYPSVLSSSSSTSTISVVNDTSPSTQRSSRSSSMRYEGSRGSTKSAAVFSRKQLMGMLTRPMWWCLRKPLAWSRSSTMTAVTSGMSPPCCVSSMTSLCHCGSKLCSASVRASIRFAEAFSPAASTRYTVA